MNNGTWLTGSKEMDAVVNGASVNVAAEREWREYQSQLAAIRGATQAPPCPPSELALATLEKAIESANEAASRLTGRVEPVLVPERESVFAAQVVANTESPRHFESPVMTRIETMTDRVNALARRLDALAARVEL